MNVLSNWKTTSAGAAVLAISALQAVKFDVSGHLAMTQRDWFTLALGVLAALVGAVQKDAKDGGNQEPPPEAK